MKKIFLLILVLLPTGVGGQALRCTYAYKHFVDETKSMAAFDPWMTLDVQGTEASFYSKSFYLADSLLKKVTRPDGSMNMDAYAQRKKLPRSAEYEVEEMDYAKGRLREYKRFITYSFSAEGQLICPEWTFLDVTKDICGYSCRKITTDFMGRRWEAWYTEEISVSAGPWLLWGAPGLILEAADSNGLFHFEATKLEEVPHGRIDVIDSLMDSPLFQHSSYQTIKELEQSYTHLRRSASAQDQLTGSHTTRIVDANGHELPIPTSFPYIPLAAERHWK